LQNHIILYDKKLFNDKNINFFKGITTVIGEFFLLYFAKEKKNVAKKKYDYVIHKRRNALATAAADNAAVAMVGATSAASTTAMAKDWFCDERRRRLALLILSSWATSVSFQERPTAYVHFNNVSYNWACSFSGGFCSSFVKHRAKDLKELTNKLVGFKSFRVLKE